MERIGGQCRQQQAAAAYPAVCPVGMYSQPRACRLTNTATDTGGNRDVKERRLRRQLAPNGTLGEAEHPPIFVCSGVRGGGVEGARESIDSYTASHWRRKSRCRPPGPPLTHRWPPASAVAKCIWNGPVSCNRCASRNDDTHRVGKVCLRCENEKDTSRERVYRCKQNL
ncbi:hypothetical protein BCR44DRAFT_393818 [Catenaria anguillulae PL171]|uniref:Uncharacterized protein n=1 Tax=Catenaria anguillulae PL171 TaxID=765915 RepID=A0A1Y2HIH6_9FUNG|nr:hypothetical protein BCR44DRAFT_393818 [Catenaria anguillulae PL171]